MGKQPGKSEQSAQARRGRPRLPIDPVVVFELALLGMNNSQIAASIPCDRKTLARLRPHLERARRQRAVLLKLRRFQSALAGDARSIRQLLAAFARGPGLRGGRGRLSK